MCCELREGVLDGPISLVMSQIERADFSEQLRAMKISTAPLLIIATELSVCFQLLKAADKT
jgi:hypothetical protein